MEKPHAVCIPFPAQGHVNPMMQLAKLLHSRGFHVSFVNSEFNHNRLVRAKGPEFLTDLRGFAFATIPDGLPPCERDATQDVPSLCDSTRKNWLEPFKELVRRLDLSDDSPRVSCVVSDGLLGFGVKAAEDLGLPEVQVWTSSTVSFMGCLMFKELIKRGIVPFKDEKFMYDGTLDMPLDWIPGMKNMRLKDMPSFARTQSIDDIMFDFVSSEAENCLKSPAIVFNTFHEFDRDLLEAITAKFPKIYNIGPLPLLVRHLPNGAAQASLWREDTACLRWLNEREPGSVVYVNYGSITTMTERSLEEFAWGLAESGHYFLWIVRPDVVAGSDSAALPVGFQEAVAGRGFLATWCPQTEVLAHPSVAVFLTHCGWNSTLEAVSSGVPIICWPFFGDQQTTCRYACTVWEIGMELEGEVERGALAGLVREVMAGPNGKRLRENVLEWKRKAVQATDVGGSSYNDFDRMIKEALTR